MQVDSTDKILAEAVYPPAKWRLPERGKKIGAATAFLRFHSQLGRFWFRQLRNRDSGDVEVKPYQPEKPVYLDLPLEHLDALKLERDVNGHGEQQQHQSEKNRHDDEHHVHR